MPKNISSLVATLLKRANIDTANPKYMDLLNISGQLSDEAYGEVESGLQRLMTLDEARYHNDLRRHFRQAALDPVDKELERWMEDMDVSDEDRATIAADKNTYTKLRKALEKTQELEHRKAGSRSTGEVRKLADELAIERKRIENLQADYALRAAQIEQQADQRMTDYALRTRLSALDYANDQVTKEEAVMGFRPLLDNELKSKGARCILDKDTNELTLVSAATGEPLLDGRRPIDFSDFVSSLAAAKRVLKTNPDATGAEPATTRQSAQHITYPTHIPAGRDLPRSNQAALHIIESRLKR